MGNQKKQYAFVQLQRDLIGRAVDTAMIASILALHEQFGFGKDRLKRFADSVQKIVEENADFYEDAVYEGLINKLHGIGIEYDGV